MQDQSRVDKMYSSFMKGPTSAAAEEQKSTPAPEKKGGKGKEEKDYARATIYLRKDQHKHLKRMAVDNDTEISALVREAVDRVFPIPNNDPNNDE